MFNIPDHNYEEYRYDANGFDVYGYDVDGFDRDGNESLTLGDGYMSDGLRLFMESHYVPIQCSNCHEELSDWWKEIRKDKCADCIRKEVNNPPGKLP